MKLGIAKDDIMRHCIKQTEIWKGDMVEIICEGVLGSDIMIRRAGTNNRPLVVFPEYIERIEDNDQIGK